MYLHKRPVQARPHPYARSLCRDPDAGPLDSVLVCGRDGYAASAPAFEGSGPEAEVRDRAVDVGDVAPRSWKRQRQAGALHRLGPLGFCVVRRRAPRRRAARSTTPSTAPSSHDSSDRTPGRPARRSHPTYPDISATAPTRSTRGNLARARPRQSPSSDRSLGNPGHADHDLDPARHTFHRLHRGRTLSCLAARPARIFHTDQDIRPQTRRFVRPSRRLSLESAGLSRGLSPKHPAASEFLGPQFQSCQSFQPNTTGHPNLLEFCDPQFDVTVRSPLAAQAARSPTAATLWEKADRQYTDRHRSSPS